MDGTIRVLLIGDYSPFLIWLQLLLEETPDVMFVGRAKDGLESLGRVLVERPDVVIFGCQLVGEFDIQVVEALRHVAALTNVLLCSTDDGGVSASSLLQTGAAGCLLAADPAPAIVEAIRTAGLASRRRRSAGESSSIGLTHIELQRFPGLTERESQVMELMSRGSSNKEISRQLKITERTVEFHVSNILLRTGRATRLQAVLWATEQARSSRSVAD